MTNQNSFAVVTLLALLFVGCTEKPRQPDIVLITADTLRADHLGIYGYERNTSPNIDSFFRDGAVFKRAYATQSNTTPSVLSMLSGLDPREHGVRLLFQLVPASLPLLPQQLPQSYESAAIVSNFVLTDEATGLAQFFDHYDDFVAERADRSQLVFERRAEGTTDAAVDWLRNRERAGPLFLWVHYIDPHGPYDPPEVWRSRFSHAEPLAIDDARIPGHMDREGLHDGLEYVDRYDEEISYLDHHVGRLLNELNDHLDLKRTLTFFVGDHGESMMEHEKWFSHGYHVYEEIVRIPFLVRGPGFDGAGPKRSPVSGKDVAPTVLSFLDIESETVMSGIDLLGPLSAQRLLFSEATHSDHQWLLAAHEESRYLLRLDADAAIDERFWFDLSLDPDQLERLPWPADSTLGATLVERAASDPDPAGWPLDPGMGRRLDAPKVHPRADAEALERLRALGYAD